jgi:hypothetical protein
MRPAERLRARVVVVSATDGSHESAGRRTTQVACVTDRRRAVGPLLAHAAPSTPPALIALRRSGGLHAFQRVRPLLVGPLRRYAPVDAVAGARTLVSTAATAPPGITIVEWDGIR